MDQVDARQHYLAVIQTQLAPFLRSNGFKRSHNTFRRFGPDGDVAIVEFQRSSGSWPGEYLFYVNLAVATRNWLEFKVSRGYGKVANTPTAADCQWWDRLISIKPHSSDIHTWRVQSAHEAVGCGEALIHAIESDVLPTFQTWLAFYAAVELAVFAGSGAQDLLSEPPATATRGIRHFRDPSSPYGAWLRRLAIENSDRA